MHRAQIGLLVKAGLDGYWKDDLSNELNVEILKMWMDALENFSNEEIKNAFISHTRESPNKKPNHGHIRSLIMKTRAKYYVTKPELVEEGRTVVTAEQANAILKEVGYRPKSFK